MAGERTSVYLTAHLAKAVKASGVPLAELIRRGLTAQPAPQQPLRQRRAPRSFFPPTSHGPAPPAPGPAAGSAAPPGTASAT